MAEVVDALGGTFRTAGVCGVVPSAVSNAKRFSRFPAGWFFKLRDACRELGFEIDESMFGKGEAA